MGQPGYSDSLLEGHEGRIQRLETGLQSVSTSAALSNQKLDSLAEKIDDGFRSVNAQLREGVVQFDTHEKMLADHRAEIVALKSTEQSRTHRWTVIRRSTLPLMAAAAGVIATKASDNIWFWLTRFFH